MLEFVTLSLALTSLTVTIIGFFASVRFYRDGVELQRKAFDALNRIEQKTALLQEHFGGVLDKTLDAVLGQLPSGAQRDQQLPMRIDDPLASAPGSTSDSSVSGSDKTADSLFRYYILLGFRMSDVSEGTSRGLFFLGSPYGYNLFNFGTSFIYTGYFPHLPEREVKARIVLLYDVFRRIEDTIDQLAEDARIEIQQALDQLAVHVIIADTIDHSDILDVINSLRVDIKMHPTFKVFRASEISELLSSQLDQLGV